MQQFARPRRRRVARRTCGSESLAPNHLQTEETALAADAAYEEAWREGDGGVSESRAERERVRRGLAHAAAQELELAQGYGGVALREAETEIDVHGLEYIMLGPRDGRHMGTDADGRRRMSALRSHVRGLQALLLRAHPTPDTRVLCSRADELADSMEAQLLLLTGIALEAELQHYFSRMGGFSAAVVRVLPPLYARLVRDMFSSAAHFVRDVSACALLFGGEAFWDAGGERVPLYRRVADPSPMPSDREVDTHGAGDSDSAWPGTQ